jgi:aspartate aminotransferase
VVGQRPVGAALGITVDAGIYKKRRDTMAGILRDASVEFLLPKGAFYFFPKVPGSVDDPEFCQLLLDERILAVAGRGFGLAGYSRLTYCWTSPSSSAPPAASKRRPPAPEAASDCVCSWRRCT